jgi:two-component system cell cycle sensor histidine kinase/response regulator CckA
MDSRPIRVLLVDDDEDDYVITRDLLSASEGAEFSLEWLASYEAALEAIGRNLYDVYLFDYRLGERNGLELLHDALAVGCKAPIILLTGQGDRALDLEAMAGGAADYLVKGQISAPLLERSIRYALERKRAEEALREINATLEAQVAARTAEIHAEKEKSEMILRNVGDAILMADAQGCVQYVNPAFTALTGYTLDEISGQPATLIEARIASGQPGQSMEVALAQEDLWQNEIVGQRKDRRTFDAMLTVVPVRDAHGNRAGCVASLQDISRRKELERARNQFLTNISHQLRTPVTSLKLSAYLVSKGLPPEDTRRFLQIVESQAARLAELIQDILEMTALDSGLAVTTWEPIAAAHLIDNSIVSFQAQAESSGLTLTTEPLPLDLPLVHGDPQRVNQALAELMANAISFTPPGGRVTVGAETVVEDGRSWVTLLVRDTGPGIPPEEQAHIFERFFRGRLAESGHVPGTGLGLSIALEIMRAHGGRITAESQVGQGSTFRLWLLAAKQEAQ